MNIKPILMALLLVCGFTTFSIRAFESNEFIDPHLEQFLANISTQPDDGLRALEDKITEIENQSGQFAPLLYGYVERLAELKQANNEYTQAVDLYQRMQTLTHWADGVNSPLQLGALRQQSRALVALGQVVKADRLERFHLQIAEKNYSNAALIPSIWRLADWQRSTMQYRKSLKNYDRALDTVEQQSLAPSLKVRTLEAKALAQYLSKTGSPQQTLAQALDIRMEDEYSDLLANRNAKLNLADLYTLKKDSAAMSLYSELNDAPVALLGPRNQQEYLSALNAAENPNLATAHMDIRYPKKTESFKFRSDTEQAQPTTSSIGEPVRLCATNVSATGFVDVTMKISANGRPSDLEIVGQVPHRTKRYLREVLMDSRYRPEIKNGQPVEQELEFRQYFDKAKPLASHQVSGWRDILAEHACHTLASR